MKTLFEYLMEAKPYTLYDEKRHIIGVDFSRLSNEGDNNILNDIEKECPHLMNPNDEEEFDDQYLRIEYDKNTLTFVTPNMFTNDSIGAPMSLTFVYKVKGDIVKDYISKNKKFTADDFKEVRLPKYLDKIDVRESEPYRFETRKLMALIMNRQPEPLW